MAKGASAIQKKLGFSKEEIANNAKMVVADNVLTIQMALDVEGVGSKSGKSQVIASSRGNKEVEGTDGAKIGLNFYKPL